MTDDAEAVELDDLAAEPDDVDMAEVDDQEYDGDDDTHTGLCVAGPYAGRTVTCRCSKGFLLVDRPTRRAWLYDLTGDVFTCRADIPMELNDTDRWRAATDADYDVMAYEVEAVQQ